MSFTPRTAARAVAAGTVLGLSLVGCSSATSTVVGSSTGGAGASGGTAKHAITVFAASSLKDVFTLLGKNFEAAHPGTTVTFSFGASSTLATQLGQGAPADVFASASQTTMKTAIAAGSVATSTVFATNVLAIATPPDNPGAVNALADLARPAVKVAVCQPAVPCGATAAQLFTKAGLTVTPVSQEADVKSVLAKVEIGEVDAGVVYATDLLAAGAKVHGITIPADSNVSTAYPIGTVTSSKEAATGAAFVAYVLSADGLAALKAAGFGSP